MLTAFFFLLLASDPVIGTWDLDLSKSSFDPGPAVQNQTRIYEQTASGVKFVLTGVSAAGAPMRVEYTAPYDGNDYPLKGSPSTNSVSLKQIDRWTVQATEKKDGVVKFNVTRVISEDGKTMTVTSTGVNLNGVKIRNVLVFHRRS